MPTSRLNLLRLGVFTLSAFAVTVRASPCSELGAPSPAWVQCSNAAMDAQDAKLETYLKAAHSRTRALGREPMDFTAAQKAWVAYRIAQCADVYLFWGYGNFRYDASLDCNLQMTRERMHDLWSSYLTFLDGAPLILPEP
jgi:uncharacterized protein YecT (DUF1311 family)